MKIPAIKCLPAVPIRRQDHIISSKVQETGEKGFTPSYENDPKINMNIIMSDEYLRTWMKERRAYEVDTFSKVEIKAGAGKIKRRSAKTIMKKSRNKGTELVLPQIKLNKFANIESKIDATEPNAMTNRKKD